MVDECQRLLFQIATGLLARQKCSKMNSDTVIHKRRYRAYQVYTDFTVDIRMYRVFMLLK